MYKNEIITSVCSSLLATDRSGNNVRASRGITQQYVKDENGIRGQCYN